MKLTLLSWNLHGHPFSGTPERRIGLAVRRIAELQPDFALLQEVWTPAQAELLVAALGESYAFIDTAPGGLTGRKGGLATLVRRDAGWNVRARFVEFRTEGFHWAFWQGDGLADKGFQWLEAEHPELALVLMNTHVQARHTPQAWFAYDAVRRAQLDELRDAAAAPEPHVPVLLAGDLNVGATGALYAEAVAPYWRDLAERERERCQCATHFGGERSPAEWIDHLLSRPTPVWRVDADVTRIRNLRHDVPYSDHDGLLATLELTPRGQARAGLAPVAAAALAAGGTRRAFLVAGTGLLADLAWPFRSSG